MLRRQLVIFCGLVVLGPLFYWALLVPGWTLADYDLSVHVQPYRHYMAEAWAQGRFPLWNQDVFMGVPFLANIQAAAVYPPNLVFALLPTSAGIGWLVAVHTGLMGAGMYLYSRRALAMGDAAASAAGLVLMFSAYVASKSGHQTLTLAWAPLLMLAADRVTVRPRPRVVAAIGALVALTLLAGHTQQAYNCFLLAAFAGARRAVIALRPLGFRRLAKGSLAGVAGVALGTLISALQLVPTIELARLSLRSGGVPLADEAAFSLPLRGMLGNLLPDYTFDHRAEFAFSVGAVALVLAVVGLLSRRPGRTLPWAALGLVGWLAAFGPRAKVFTLLYDVLPGFALFRTPARTLLFTTVALAVLAGWGVQTLVTAAPRRRGGHVLAAALAAVLVPTALIYAWTLQGSPDLKYLSLLPTGLDDLNLAVMAGFAGSLGLAVMLMAVTRRRRLALLIPLVLFADLWLLGAQTYPRNPLPDRIYEQPPAVLAVSRPGLDDRLLVLVLPFSDLPEVRAGREADGLSPYLRARYLSFLDINESVAPNRGMVWGAASPDGYDAGVLPTSAEIAWRRDVVGPRASNAGELSIRDMTDHAWSTSWLRDSAVDIVVAPTGTDPNPPGCRCLAPAGTASGLTSWRWTGPDPPVRARVQSASGRRPARVVSDTGERVIVDVPDGPSGQLVLADAFYPGWTASVDGREVAVERVDGYVRGVAVGTGQHRVVFEYRPAWLVPAVAATGAGILVALGLSLVPERRLRLRRSRSAR